MAVDDWKVIGVKRETKEGIFEDVKSDLESEAGESLTYPETVQMLCEEYKRLKRLQSPCADD